MKCYTYKLTLKNDPRYYYYGVRNIYQKKPEKDNYFGSGTGLRALKKQYGKDCFIKEILNVFLSREDCLTEEKRLVSNYWKTDPFCLNRMPGGAFNSSFDLTDMFLIHNATEIRYVAKNVLQDFIKNGWSLGMSEESKQKLRGKVSITDGIHERRVREEDIAGYEKDGWHVGRSEKVLEELHSRIPITDGIQTKCVLSEDLQEYLEKGWHRGHSTSHIENSGNAQRGMVWISKGQQITKVHPDELDMYLKDGWTQGNYNNRKKVRTPSQRKRSYETQIGRMWISNGESSKKVYPKDLQGYLDQGWKLGRGH